MGVAVMSPNGAFDGEIAAGGKVPEAGALAPDSGLCAYGGMMLVGVIFG